ncbi:deoxyribose-phosphate aldolase [Legionella nagasakiensis]|uniref:deoxyribose-phosphate aldolase n=1 Tax=Legionella nagasakiensis TaxID=535290 RepID=UPI0013EFBECE|nr:deoxyribose-phosphate aldolase [Legionella nagasakiensis]
MTLTEQLTQTLQTLRKSSSNTPNWREVIPLLDLTLLNNNATATEIRTLAKKAETHQTAAVCVLPQHLAWLPSFMTVKRATVANFPSGNQPQEHVMATIEEIIKKQQADEIDYVFSYSSYLRGQRESAFFFCERNYQLCKRHGVLFKVILETGAFPSMETIYEASIKIIQRGCDFLKTSTGKIPIGATVPAAFAMLQAIKDTKANCGIKLSGGIKTLEQALEYIHLAQHALNQNVDSHWFRLGASTLLDQLLEKNQ